MYDDPTAGLRADELELLADHSFELAALHGSLSLEDLEHTQVLHTLAESHRARGREFSAAAATIKREVEQR